jgi:hypothetical protein
MWMHRGEVYRAHHKGRRRIGLWTGLGYWRTRSNHSNHTSQTDRTSLFAEFIDPKYRAGAPGLVHGE